MTGSAKSGITASAFAPDFTSFNPGYKLHFLSGRFCDIRNIGTFFANR